MRAIISLKFVIVLDDSDRPVPLQIHHRINKRNFICCAHQLFQLTEPGILCRNIPENALIAVIAWSNFTPCTRSPCGEKNSPWSIWTFTSCAMDLERDRMIKILQSYHDLKRLLNFRNIIVLITTDPFSNLYLFSFVFLFFSWASPKLRHQDGCGSDFSLFQKLGRLPKFKMVQNDQQMT